MNPIVNLPGQQPQRQADHAGLVAQQTLDRKVGFAGIGGPKNGQNFGRVGSVWIGES